VGNSAPFVVAEKIDDIAKPTLLLYCHYDVQPVDREKWDTDPFKLVEKNGRLYGRGASDDKAGIIAIITALNAYQETSQKLPVNVKILFEGEEEYAVPGTNNMDDLLKEEAKRLSAHALVILDAVNIDENTGTLTSSTRGVVTMKIEVKALNKPVHSGLGCLAPDPAQALAKLIHSFHDPRAIPSFMENCESLSSEEKELLVHSSCTEQSYLEEYGIIKGSNLRGDPKVSIYQRILEEPSISVLNMSCGKPNGGYSIQDVASCEIGIRITPGQEPERVADVFRNYLLSQTIPYNLPVEIKKSGVCTPAWKATMTGPFSKAYLDALGKNFSKVGVQPTGGSLPLITIFKKYLPNIEVILAGVGDPKTSAHSHNESQDKELLQKTINSLIRFMHNSKDIHIQQI
jgi:acetylornithine deacetylase/succinyl-diaminopimelate desuccinylase-like protein